MTMEPVAPDTRRLLWRSAGDGVTSDAWRDQEQELRAV